MNKKIVINPLLLLLICLSISIGTYKTTEYYHLSKNQIEIENINNFIKEEDITINELLKEMGSLINYLNINYNTIYLSDKIDIKKTNNLILDKLLNKLKKDKNLTIQKLLNVSNYLDIYIYEYQVIEIQKMMELKQFVEIMIINKTKQNINIMKKKEINEVLYHFNIELININNVEEIKTKLKKRISNPTIKLY